VVAAWWSPPDTSLGVVLTMNGAVQVLGALLGAVRGLVPHTVGPVVFAVLLALAAIVHNGRDGRAGRGRSQRS
jgi:hypothetical protein